MAHFSKYVNVKTNGASLAKTIPFFTLTTLNYTLSARLYHILHLSPQTMSACILPLNYHPCNTSNIIPQIVVQESRCVFSQFMRVNVKRIQFKGLKVCILIIQIGQCKREYRLEGKCAFSQFREDTCKMRYSLRGCMGSFFLESTQVH